MIGCGCVVILGLLGALVYSVLHGLWMLTGGVAVIAIVGVVVAARAIAAKARKDNEPHPPGR